MACQDTVTQYEFESSNQTLEVYEWDLIHLRKLHESESHKSEVS